MAIARFPGVIIDCPDPTALAEFYGSLLDWGVTVDEGWAEIRPVDGSDCISFQQVEGYRAPQWPDQNVPQQMHLDLIVDDLDEGEETAIRLGASTASTVPDKSFRVLLDPAGHPFCLCVD
ncbi:VOC family protein [Saxibacter everestensis]|uniref:VOC family protein n=1 Tax=Saxibacter everestensis TaxID=2909229 RepID=A0ABY8QUK0_9MICO|nr:VOC family protein [Brevibacteriaceae bacterium ZFBP1038]